jgi:hypothetical protein
LKLPAALSLKATRKKQLATGSSTVKTDKYGDLRRRLVFLLLALVVYRLGTHIPVPGIDPNQTKTKPKTVNGDSSIRTHGFTRSAFINADQEMPGFML